MRLRDILVLTGTALAAHRLRSVLTTLGIVIGIASVIVLTSIGEGTRKFVNESFSQFGTNLLAVNPGKIMTSGSPGAMAGTMRKLTIEDAEALSRIPGVETAMPVSFGMARVEWGAADLKLIYTSSTVELAEQMLTDFENKWGKDYQSIGLSWRRNWARIIPFFDYPPEIRKVIYTTNAIESINMSLRKVIKTRSSFPTDEAVTKLFYLALRNISKKWTMPIRDWKAALNRFSIQFEERISPS